MILLSISIIIQHWNIMQENKKNILKKRSSEFGYWKGQIHKEKSGERQDMNEG